MSSSFFNGNHTEISRFSSSSFLSSNTATLESSNVNLTVTTILFVAPYNRPYWIVNEFFLIITMLLSVCLITWFAQHHYTNSQNNIEARRIKLLHALCCSGLVFLVLTAAGTQVFAFSSWKSNQSCSKCVKLISVFYAVGLLAVRLSLWMQQHFLYTHAVMQVSMSNYCVHTIRWVILLMTVLKVPIFLIFILGDYSGWIYVASSTGCIKIYGHYNIRVALSLYRLLVVLGIAALFIYPFIMLKIQLAIASGSRIKHGHDAKKFFSYSMTPEYRAKICRVKSLLKHVRKAFVLSCVCLVDDLTFDAIYNYIDFHVFGMFVMSSANLLADMTCVVICYDHWKLLFISSKLRSSLDSNVELLSISLASEDSVNVIHAYSNPRIAYNLKGAIVTCEEAQQPGEASNKLDDEEDLPNNDEAIVPLFPYELDFRL